MSRTAELLRSMPPERRRAWFAQVYPSLPRAARQDIDAVLANEFDAGVRADPFTLARWLEPGDVEDWASSRLLARKFRQLINGESRLQVWNAPPQTVGKSTWAQRGVLWALDQHPDRTAIYISYGDTLAHKASAWIRDKAREHEHRLRFGLGSKESQSEWKTDRGGGVVARGIYSGVAGHSATLCVVIDDPMKNWQQAHADAERARVWDEIRAVAITRLGPDAGLLITHSRLHLDDPTGRMQQLAEEIGVDLDVTTIPMLARDNDALGREPGQPLERFTLDQAQRRASMLGSYLAAALEQQDPQRSEGSEFKRAWWQWYDDDVRGWDQAVMSWDMKLKDKASGDYVSGMAWCRIGGKYYGLDSMHKQFTFLQTKAAIALMSTRWPAIHRVLIENTGNGPEVIRDLSRGDPEFMLSAELSGVIGATADEAGALQDLMRRGMSGLVPRTPKDSKIVRARRHMHHVENGDCYLPEQALWAASFVDECATFPKRGGRDDQVDAWSQAMDALSTGTGAIDTTGSDRVVRPGSAPAGRGSVARSQVRVIGRH